MFIEPTTEQLEKIKTAIASVKGLPGVKVELTGLWVWISGETKPHKETLKAAGYRWASKKHMWYFAGVPSSGKGKDMIYVRAKYGSLAIKSDSDVNLS